MTGEKNNFKKTELWEETGWEEMKRQEGDWLKKVWQMKPKPKVERKRERDSELGQQDEGKEKKKKKE